MDQKADVEPTADLAVPVSEHEHLAGSASAPVMLVEYGDYECPYCLNAQPVVQEVRRQLGDRVGFVFRHFPQNSIHPHASAAAQAAEAAGAQGKFWEMHELLFRHQKDLAEIDLTHLALTLGLEIYRFTTDMQGTSVLRRIREDFAGGVRSGVTGTPTFFISGRRYRGATTAQDLITAMSSDPNAPTER